MMDLAQAYEACPDGPDSLMTPIGYTERYLN